MTECTARGRWDFRRARGRRQDPFRMNTLPRRVSVRSSRRRSGRDGSGADPTEPGPVPHEPHGLLMFPMAPAGQGYPGSGGAAAQGLIVEQAGRRPIALDQEPLAQHQRIHALPEHPFPGSLEHAQW
jgi:hypothetical protein